MTARFARNKLVKSIKAITHRHRYAKIVQLVVFSIFFLCVFILLPALWFSAMIEPEWTYLDGVYFSFVTLSTIGFGDIIARKEGEGTSEFQKVGFEILTMGWILLGLGYLFMVFTLATETYVEFYRLAASRLTTREKKVKPQAYVLFLTFFKQYFKSFCL